MIILLKIDTLAAGSHWDRVKEHITSWSQSCVLGREEANLNCNLSDEVDSVRTCIIGQHRAWNISG